VSIIGIGWLGNHHTVVNTHLYIVSILGGRGGGGSRVIWGEVKLFGGGGRKLPLCPLIASKKVTKTNLSMGGSSGLLVSGFNCTAGIKVS
jgi:hypothetical protein